MDSGCCWSVLWSPPPLLSWRQRGDSVLPRPSREAVGWLTLVNQLSSCHLFVVAGGSGSGAGASRGSFSSLSLELLSLSESEELSDSLLSDSALLECADATGSGSVCGALQGKRGGTVRGSPTRAFFPRGLCPPSLPACHAVDSGHQVTNCRGGACGTPLLKDSSSYELLPLPGAQCQGPVGQGLHSPCQGL